MRFRNLGDIYANLTVRNGKRLESLTTLSHLVEEHMILQIIECNLTGSLVQYGAHGGCGNDELFALFLYLIISLAILRHDDETLLVAEPLLGSSLHTDNLIAHHLEANLTRTKILVLFQLNGKIVTFLNKAAAWSPEALISKTAEINNVLVSFIQYF